MPWLLGMLVAVHPAHAYEPQANYMLNCMGCHLEDGSGAPGKVPSLRNTLVPFAQTPAGRRYLVQVPGTSQSALSDREIAELLNWMIRSLSDRPVPRDLGDFTARGSWQLSLGKAPGCRCHPGAPAGGGW